MQTPQRDLGCRSRNAGSGNTRTPTSRRTTGCTGPVAARTGTGCAPSAIRRICRRATTRDRHLRHDLVRHRRRLRGLSRSGLAPRRLGADTADGAPRRSRTTHGVWSVTTSRISPRRMVELCAPCHSRRAELGDYDHSGAELLDHMLPSLAASRACTTPTARSSTRCTSTALSCKARCMRVRCLAPTATTATACNCIARATSCACSVTSARSTTRATITSTRRSTKTQASDGAKCVKCHMVERPFMVVDWRADHSFRVPRPDLSSEIGTPNACTPIGMP